MFGDDVMGRLADGTESWRVRPCRLGHDHPCARASHTAAPGFSTEAVQTPARVNVTCVTPLGEEVASTS